MVQGGENSSSNSSSFSRVIVALKPRQVLLAEQKQKQKEKEKQKHKEKPKTMAKKQQQPESNHLALLHSVIKFIHDKGFSKTFKRFLKEAQVGEDAWKADSFDLEEMYCKYLENCTSADTNFKGHNEQEQSAYGTMDQDATVDKDAPVETTSKKKKKKKKNTEENDDRAKSAISELKVDESAKELIDKKKKKSKLTSESLDENGKQEDSLPCVTEGKPESLESKGGNDNKDSMEATKSKDKLKKQKLRMVSPVEDGKGTESAIIRDTDAANIPLDDNKTKLKEKKRKKKDIVSETLSDTGVENKGNSRVTSQNVANKESKKRKRSGSDETENKPVEGAAIEESKRRKTKGVEEAEVVVKQGEVNTVLVGDGHVGGETEKENGDISQRELQKSSIKEFDESTKGDLKKNGVERSAVKKTAKKQHNGSAEPKTVNAFQRVKVDAVEFADGRLQDNSYWAKDGADTGYGAKAQEVLGLVKGRGFRHEKTKKKRGSYRGGQIDLQSHSVKFNYSDEE